MNSPKSLTACMFAWHKKYSCGQSNNPVLNRKPKRCKLFWFLELNSFPERSRTSGLFKGLSSPGKCHNTIPGLSWFSKPLTNPVIWTAALYYHFWRWHVVHRLPKAAYGLPRPQDSPARPQPLFGKGGMAGKQGAQRMMAHRSHNTMRTSCYQSHNPKRIERRPFWRKFRRIRSWRDLRLTRLAKTFFLFGYSSWLVS